MLAEFVKWGDEGNQPPRDFRWEKPSTTHHLEILKSQYHLGLLNFVPLLRQCVFSQIFPEIALWESMLHRGDSSI